ncbi:hypothetical protein QVD17_31708 [Tagetes erecta]|uniref:Uncharacterized protein n=1 Tax=Tagetes erecta TaxID=13708 RepID=A0AAD8NH99_TARER|nr:hypothetical protein QVD17_31708 [Tagetes erecta]
MAGHTYVIPRRYNYNDFQAQEGGYAYGQEQLVNSYVVETTVERVRVPASRYTTFGGGPLKNGNQRGDMFKYSPKDRYEGYEQVYASDVENSVPPRYHEEDNLMTNFRNKLQIGTSQPMKSNGLSSPNKHRPSSPNKYRPKSPKPYRPASPDKYLPSSLNKYQPSSPDKFPSTISDKYRPHSPNKYRPSSPNKYRSTIPDKYRPPSPNKYRPTSPKKYHPSSPNKYRHDSPDKFGASSPIKYRSTSPDSYHHKSPNKYRPTSPNKYHPSSTNKSQVKSPSKYRPTSPTHDYPSKEALMVKAHPLPGPTKYQPSSPTKYKPTGPTHIYPTKDDPVKKAQHLPVLNKYQHTDPNYRWQSEGPPPTRHPLTGPTNDINEALGFLMETVNYAPRSDPRREGAFDTLSPRARPIDHERRYARSGFGGATDQPYLKSNTINSEEAVRRYNGVYVP